MGENTPQKQREPQGGTFPFGFFWRFWIILYTPADNFLRRLAKAVEQDGTYRFIQLLSILSIGGIIYGAYQFFHERDDRKLNRQNAAWSFIIAARGSLEAPSVGSPCQVSNWGLSSALELLAEDEVPLERLNLPSAYLKNLNLSGANLRKSMLDCGLLDGAKLNGANMNEASFARADLACAQLRSATLVEASFVDANLRKADFEGADLSQASFRSARLIGASLANADLTSADLAGAVLLGADLSGTSGITPEMLARTCISQELNVLPSSWSPEQRRQFAWPPVCKRWSTDEVESILERPCD